MVPRLILASTHSMSPQWGRQVRPGCHTLHARAVTGWKGQGSSSHAPFIREESIPGAASTLLLSHWCGHGVCRDLGNGVSGTFAYVCGGEHRLVREGMVLPRG